MKHVTTILCSLAFLLAGWFLAVGDGEGGFSKHQTLSAATLSDYQTSMLPLDVQLDLGKRVQIPDTVKIHDTTYVDRPQVLVINQKCSRVNRPKSVTDVAWMFLNPGKSASPPVSNQSIPDREEKTGESIVGTPESHNIQLIVDGQTVYSKNDNHSTGESQ